MRILEKVLDIFGIWHFHNASKEVFWPKKNWISCMDSKVPFWLNGKTAKMALFNPCMKFNKFFGQKTSFEVSWKCSVQKIFITCSKVHKIQDLAQSKYKLRLFSKRTHEISKFLFIYDSYESLASLESKNRRCPFFGCSEL